MGGLIFMVAFDKVCNTTGGSIDEVYGCTYETT